MPQNSDDERGKTFGAQWHMATLLFVVALAVGYWLWFGTTQRSIIGDEGISILMAEGILEHGYPRLPSGFIYHRAYLPGYLLATSIGVLGLNDLAIMLPSLLLAAGSLLITYRFGRDVLGQPVVGLVAAVLLVLLSDQTFYATSARMYMSLQFFTTLAIYAGWRGLCEGLPRYQWLTFLAVAGALLSHKQGGTLLIALPLSVLAIRWLTKDGSAIHWVRTGIGLGMLTGIFLIASVYQPEDMIRQIILHSGAETGLSGLNFDLEIWAQHGLALDSVIPFGFVLGPVIVAGVVGVIRSPSSPARSGFLFGIMNLALFALAICTNVLVFAPRMWVAILPLLLVVSLSAIAHAQTWLRDWRASLIGVWGCSVALASLAFLLADDPLERILDGYGSPCSKGVCRRQMASDYRLARAWVSEDDRIVATNPWVAHYYLGRVDAVLRERRVGRSYLPFKETKDEYFGVEIVDRIDRLEGIWRSPQRAWIFADHKIRSYSSPEMRAVLRTHFVLRHSSPLLRVFTNQSERTHAKMSQDANPGHRLRNRPSGGAKMMGDSNVR